MSQRDNGSNGSPEGNNSGCNDDNWMEWAVADEARAQAEAAALFRAYPKRRMIGLKWIGKRDYYALECGHFAPTQMHLDDDTYVRCRTCYALGMERAEKMLEG